MKKTIHWPFPNEIQLIPSFLIVWFFKLDTLTVIYDLWSWYLFFWHFILWFVFPHLAEDGWCAKDQDINQYIQIDFFLKTRVTRVGVLRRNSKSHWVTRYSLQYSDDDITWTDYIENGHVKVGNIT